MTRRRTTPVRVHQWIAIAIVVLGTAVAWDRIGPATSLGDDRGPAPLALSVGVGCLAVLSGTLLVLAGPAVVARGPRSSARVGWAVILVGTICPATVVSQALDPGQPTSLVGPATRLLGTLLCAALVVAALRGWRSTVHPAVEATGALLVIVVAFLVMSTAQLNEGRWLDGTPALHVGIELASAVGWLGVALVLTQWRDPAAPVVLGPFLPSALALAHLCRAASGGRVDELVLLASAIVLAAAAVTARTAWTRLTAQMDVDRYERRRGEEALHMARGLAAEQASQLSDVTHDARNACAGVKAAVEMLCRHGDRLDASTSATLRELAISGIGQIEDVVALDERTSTALDLAVIAREIAGARRLLGADITVRGGSAVATAAPGDIARLLLNLVVNAERHGWGTPIEVVVDARAVDVRVTVADRGPGIDPERLDDLFERGARGRFSDGRGLGLPIARELARAHGGDLRLVPAPGGACFELTLPRAGATARPAPESGHPRTLTRVTRHREPARVG